jgi:hypothetical protein
LPRGIHVSEGTISAATMKSPRKSKCLSMDALLSPFDNRRAVLSASDAPARNKNVGAQR